MTSKITELVLTKSYLNDATKKPQKILAKTNTANVSKIDQLTAEAAKQRITAAVTEALSILENAMNAVNTAEGAASLHQENLKRLASDVYPPNPNKPEPWVQKRKQTAMEGVPQLQQLNLRSYGAVEALQQNWVAAIECATAIDNKFLQEADRPWKEVLREASEEANKVAMQAAEHFTLANNGFCKRIHQLNGQIGGPLYFLLCEEKELSRSKQQSASDKEFNKKCLQNPNWADLSKELPAAYQRLAQADQALENQEKESILIQSQIDSANKINPLTPQEKTERIALLEQQGGASKEAQIDTINNTYTPEQKTELIASLKKKQAALKELPETRSIAFWQVDWIKTELERIEKKIRKTLSKT